MKQIIELLYCNLQAKALLAIPLDGFQYLQQGTDITHLTLWCAVCMHVKNYQTLATQ